MSSEFDQGQLHFEFSDAWRVVQYDKHRDYTQAIAKLQGTKAVDFIALCAGSHRVADMFWIEVTDIRGFRIENKTVQSDGQLAAEVGEKVRDSIAGLIGASQVSSTPEVWLPFVERLRHREPPMKVILWLEEDRPPARARNSIMAERVRMQSLKKRLQWLTSKVAVANLATGNCPEGLKVSNLPGAAHP